MKIATWNINGVNSRLDHLARSYICFNISSPTISRIGFARHPTSEYSDANPLSIPSQSSLPPNRLSSRSGFTNSTKFGKNISFCPTFRVFPIILFAGKLKILT